MSTILKKTNRALFFLPFCLFTILPFTAANAQLIEITAKDTTGLSTAMLANHGEFVPLKFTNGTMVYDRPGVKPYSVAYIMSNDISVPAVLEPEQTLRISLVKKKGEWTAEYKGKNANASLFNKQLEKLSAHGWETVTLDEYDDEQVKFNPNFDFDAELARVAKEYPLTLKAADKVADDSLRQAYRNIADATYLASRIACLSAKDKAKGIDAAADTQLQSLIASINPDNEAMNDLGLVEKFIQAKVKGSRQDDNLTEYAVNYTRAVDENVKNAKVRHSLFNNIAMTVFNTEKPFVLDDFWGLYKQVADTGLVNYYQTIVDSKLATKSGTPCPDETFEDVQGNKHQLSEFWNKGKYTYIDMWATWCIPCVKEIPYVAEHVNYYKDNPKLQFVSISIDTNHDAWKRKLAKDNPQWPQFISATKDEMNKLLKDWGVTGIPRFILINPDGTINNSNAFRPSDPKFYELMDAIIK